MVINYSVGDINYDHYKFIVHATGGWSLTHVGLGSTWVRKESGMSAKFWAALGCDNIIQVFNNKLLQ